MACTLSKAEGVRGELLLNVNQVLSIHGLLECTSQTQRSFDSMNLPHVWMSSEIPEVICAKNVHVMLKPLVSCRPLR